MTATSGQGGQIGAQVPDERQLLRQAIVWARANGWRHTWHPIHGHNWEGPENYAVDVQVTTDRREAAMDIYVPGALSRIWPRSIAEALDVLAAVGVLPPQLSSAYQAGRREVLDGAGCPPGSGLGRWVESNTHYDVEFQTADGETRIECFGPGGDRTSPYHAARTFAQRLHSDWVRSELRRSRADIYHADETVLERFGAWEPVDGGGAS